MQPTSERSSAATTNGPPPPKTRLQTRLWQRFVLGVFVGTTRTVQKMPRPSALRLGAGLGNLAFRLDPRRRRYAESNLRLAFSDTLSPDERDDITRQTFVHWGKSTIEFLRAPLLGPSEMDALVAGIEGREYLDAAQAAGTGFILVTGHLGNFEFLGRWLAAQGVPSTVLVRAPGDPAFAAYLREMREYGGNVALPKGTSVRELLGVLKKKQVLTLGIDQNSGDLFLPFFGTPAGTVAGPALLALRTKVPIVPAFCVRETDDRYRIVFLPPLSVEDTGDKDADIARIMGEANQVLEDMVRRFPEQWLWLHNRWKAAFEEKNRARWPKGFDRDASFARWNGLS